MAKKKKKIVRRKKQAKAVAAETVVTEPKKNIGERSQGLPTLNPPKPPEEKPAPHTRSQGLQP